MEAEEADFQKVKEFFRNHLRARLEEASRATGVERKAIIAFIKEGRLQVTLPQEEALQEGLVCERCGKPIVQGKICEECKKKLSLLVAQGKGEERKTHPGFYFKDVLEKKSRKP